MVPRAHAYGQAVGCLFGVLEKTDHVKTTVFAEKPIIALLGAIFSGHLQTQQGQCLR